jgi:DNA-binding SARP family transcriptional activator
MTGGSGANEEALAALVLLREQGAWHLVWRASLLAGATGGNASAYEQAIHDIARVAPSALRAEAGVICASLGQLDPLPTELEDCIGRSPASWLPHIRRGVASSDQKTRRANALLLERYGEFRDVAVLRSFARTHERPEVARQLGRALARRTAPRVFVQDLGRTHLEIGDRIVEATSIRRKVAALVAYLMTRPGFTAAREQVIEALWPDSPPGVGTNSLHQTIYFLRRDLEPLYSEDVSAGYVRLEGELVWLDPDLVDSASRRFTALAASKNPGIEDAEAAIQLYRGRFAPEFEYEDWAAATRDALHAAYLELVERTVDRLATAGDWIKAAQVARVALAVDPDADRIEQSLIALYHEAGSHAAAAEQYAHFAAGHRASYGVEAPSLEEIVSSPNRP